ncbi:MAG TPA: hypothetical protein DIW15_00290 [Bavariicoccus seileri]|uniref:Phage tail tape measure protein n=1 Tax=Bavariicoccus seileri TaxID=549685 RepID=A0A3D4S2S9_9ENTE|nr:hypothetical protein [Bavariicoccus seileri]HCS93133.1 hypothetical protein [Bavariicoccus seileri]
MAGRIKGITIEIEGKTQGLQKALKSVNDVSVNLNRELKDVNKLLKFDPKNQDLAAQKQKILSEAIENTKTKLNALKDAQSQVASQFAKGEIDEGQYRAFEREIAETEGSLRSYQSQLNKTQTEQDRFDKNTQRLQTLFDATGTSIDDFSDILGTRLTNAIKDGTASSDQLEQAINKIGRSAIGQDGDINQLKNALDKIDDGDSIDVVKQEIEELGDQSLDSKEKVNQLVQIAQSDAFNQLADKAGAISDKIFEIGGKSIEAAATVRANNAQFTQVFGDLEDAATKSVDTMGDKMGILPERLKPGYAAISSQLMSLGVSQEEAMSLAEQALTSSADAAAFYDTSLEDAQGSIQSFIKGNLSAAEGVGIFASANGLSQYALDNAGKAANKSGKEYEKMTEAEKQSLRTNYISDMQQKAEVTGQAARESDGYENVMGNLKSTIDQFMAAIGDEALNMFSEAIQALIPFIQSLVDWFTNLDPVVKQIMTVIVIVTALVLALIPIIAAFALAQTALNIALLPMIAIIVAVIAVISLIVIAIMNWGAITDWLSEKWQIFKDWLSQLWDSISTKAGEIWSAITLAISNFVTSCITTIQGLWDSAKNYISGIWNSISTTASTIWNNIKTSISDAITNAKNKVAEVVNSIKTKISGVWEDIKSTTSRVWNSVRDAIEKPINKAKDIVRTAIDTIKGLFDFNFSWPHMEMPHFSISGSMNPLKWLDEGVPSISVDWYAKGGILTKPTVFGQNGNSLMVGGEAGKEAVAPLSDLMAYVQAAVKAENETQNVAFLEMIKILKEIKDKDTTIVMNKKIVAKELASDIKKENDKNEFQKNRGRGLA